MISVIDLAGKVRYVNGLRPTKPSFKRVTWKRGMYLVTVGRETFKVMQVRAEPVKTTGK